jgi:hypothetical protein
MGVKLLTVTQSEEGASEKGAKENILNYKRESNVKMDNIS